MSFTITRNWSSTSTSPNENENFCGAVMLLFLGTQYTFLVCIGSGDYIISELTAQMYGRLLNLTL